MSRIRNTGENCQLCTVPESGLRRAESVLPSGMSGFPGGGPPLPLPGGAFQMAAAGSSGGGARPLLLAAASSGDRCRINWTSGEYSPHFVSTCTGEKTLDKLRETVPVMKAFTFTKKVSYSQKTFIPKRYTIWNFSHVPFTAHPVGNVCL
jgi:hypothetical protein